MISSASLESDVEQFLIWFWPRFANTSYAPDKPAPATTENEYANEIAKGIVEYNRLHRRLPPPHLKGTDFAPPLTTAHDVRTRIVASYSRSRGDFEAPDSGTGIA